MGPAKTKRRRPINEDQTATIGSSVAFRRPKGPNSDLVDVELVWRVPAGRAGNITDGGVGLVAGGDLCGDRGEVASRVCWCGSWITGEQHLISSWIGDSKREMEKVNGDEKKSAVADHGD